METMCIYKKKYTNKKTTLANLSEHKQTGPPLIVDDDGHVYYYHNNATTEHQLNVSQSEFGETEEKIVESEGNLMVFRFLFERFANKRAPEMRFQAVLTAFQTLGK